VKAGDVEAVILIVAVATVRQKRNVCEPAKLVVAMGEQLGDANRRSFQ
jgi:uncharacterized membrane protein